MLNNIRNFSIIAHIDHGKTTLTDRFLELTKAVRRDKLKSQMMDSNPIERERGITIKLAPVRMNYTAQDGQNYILNLIDTPGHVDFGYEVSRSLAACEGALLIVDATQGVQAQTLSNFHKARELGLTIIPVINKVDLPVADTDQTTLELIDAFGFREEEIIAVSAKSGLNVAAVLEQIVRRLPPPITTPAAPPRALIITATFDRHKGAIAYVRMIDGAISAKDELFFINKQKSFSPLDLGFFTPAPASQPRLTAGEVGFIATGLKDIRDLQIGDTITSLAHKDVAIALSGYREPKPVVFMELFPIDADEFPLLLDAVTKLSFHDAALQFSSTHSNALGSGLRAGFLGILHAEIVLERLQKEFDIALIATSPTVEYQVIMKNTNQTRLVHSPVSMPDPSQISSIQEPIIHAQIFSPEAYVSSLIQFVQNRRGILLESEYLLGNTVLKIELPLSELITNFHDELKSLSSGFASLEYELAGFKEVDALKVNILLNGEVIEALSFIAVASEADQQGRNMVSKLKEVVPRQMFEIPIQAAIGGKIIARETIKAFRKDVTAKLYGGDVTRRQKLLKKQAKGKKRMKQFGKVELSQDVFLSLLRK
ncbi:translation elongation factor 4 [Microgenomates group bacterium]|nr:translation elongation factor 4 [Microgenomates group bacterium]